VAELSENAATFWFIPTGLIFYEPVPELIERLVELV
jgi:hypothetical protein